MRNIFVQERCPRCDGHVYLNTDQYGQYVQCFQCGYTRDLELSIEVQKGLHQTKRRRAAR